MTHRITRTAVRLVCTSTAILGLAACKGAPSTEEVFTTDSAGRVTGMRDLAALKLYKGELFSQDTGDGRPMRIKFNGGDAVVCNDRAKWCSAEVPIDTLQGNDGSACVASKLTTTTSADGEELLRIRFGVCSRASATSQSFGKVPAGVPTGRVDVFLSNGQYSGGGNVFLLATKPSTPSAIARTAEKTAPVARASSERDAAQLAADAAAEAANAPDIAAASATAVETVGSTDAGAPAVPVENTSGVSPVPAAEAGQVTLEQRMQAQRALRQEEARKYEARAAAENAAVAAYEAELRMKGEAARRELKEQEAANLSQPRDAAAGD